MSNPNPMTLPLVEQTIRIQFNGPENAGLRAKIRKMIAAGSDISTLSRTVAFTPLGRTKLAIVRQAMIDAAQDNA